MLDEDPVIVSEKDFTPTPSSSPVPSADHGSEEKMDAPASGRAALDASAVVSDDEEGAEIVPSAAAEGMPTADDVTAADELALSISAAAAPPVVPSPRQIVSIGTESDSYAFTFHEEEMNEILSKIPVGWKVCVVSVVGVSSFVCTYAAILRGRLANYSRIDGRTTRHSVRASRFY
jgi:hypothetical protein